jgi:hypothetical protein
LNSESDHGLRRTRAGAKTDSRTTAEPEKDEDKNNRRRGGNNI